MGKESFFFDKPVGILESINEPHRFREKPRATIKMVQNGYELDYEGKDFVASTLDEALKMIKKWMEMSLETAESEAKEEA